MQVVAFGSAIFGWLRVDEEAVICVDDGDLVAFSCDAEVGSLMFIDTQVVIIQQIL